MEKQKMKLTVTSIQSPNADDTCRQIAHYLGRRLGLAAEFVGDIPWQERERRLDAGEIQLGWICGLPYIWKADRRPPTVELAAAPVMQHARYGQRPVYFSDVIVRAASRYERFADLRGTVWAYNEPHSHSGYNVVRYHLASLGEMSGFFGRVIEAGSHLAGLAMVLDGRIDAMAIDSTVLELELAARPELSDELRVIDTLGPSPMPPWVVSSGVAGELKEAIRRAFWQMHKTAEGRASLAAGQIMKLVPVTDSDYDSIRHMEQAGRDVSWS
jgi:phosphonate transport system substrate-binding protein